MQANRARAAFVRELRRVLSDLYNPGILRRSPLIQLLGVADRRDPTSALQHILTEAIEALAPGEEVPPGSPAWRVYQVLHGRFVAQFSQEEVARDLFLSARQVRRQERLAIEVLADRLWNAYGLEMKADWLEQGEAPEDIGVDASALNEELAWLEKTLPTQPVDFDDLIQTVLHTAQPLLQALEVVVTCQSEGELLPLTVQPTAVRQALLQVLTTVARRVPRGRIHVHTSLVPDRFYGCIRIMAYPSGPLASPLPGAEELALARKILELSRGTLELEADSDGHSRLAVSVTLPTAEQMPVLVIDDNIDTLRLFERYLSGTRYRFIGTPDPRGALSLAARLKPKAVVLDIMLPEVDGWDLLGRLREHPKTHDVPVIVCTILPQAELASVLGAAEFIAKPVRRQALLSALDRLVGTG
jgi:CheY-like chemotaxis protein